MNERAQRWAATASRLLYAARNDLDPEGFAEFLDLTLRRFTGVWAVDLVDEWDADEEVAA